MSLTFTPFEDRLELHFDILKISLLDIPLDQWRDMLAFANIQIVEPLVDTRAASFILSESSLIAQKDALVLITCGGGNIANFITILGKTFPQASALSGLWLRRFPRATTRRTDCDEVLRVIRDSLRLDCATSSGSSAVSELYPLGSADAWERRCKILQLVLNFKEKAPQSRFETCQSELQTLLISSLESETGFKSHQHHFTPHGFSLNAIWSKGYAALHATPPYYLSIEIGATDSASYELFSARARAYLEAKQMPYLLGQV